MRRATVAGITRQSAVHLNGVCAGGIISAGFLGHLTAQGRLGEIASLSLLVSALDNEHAGTASAFTGREIAAAAVAESARRGYLDGQVLSGVFAWLRPNDLIWNYVVNNYLLGKAPPAFDVLFWNQDTVRLAAGLHRDFIHLSLENSITRAGARSARQRRGPRRHRSGQLHRRGPHRSHRPVGERVSQHTPAGRHAALHPLHEWPHPGARQPTRSEQSLELPAR